MRGNSEAGIPSLAGLLYFYVPQRCRVKHNREVEFVGEVCLEIVACDACVN